MKTQLHILKTNTMCLITISYIKIKKNEKLKRKGKRGGTWYDNPRVPKRPWIPKKIVKSAEVMMKALVTGAFAANKDTHNEALEHHKLESKRRKLRHEKDKRMWKMNTPDDYLAREKELTHWNQMDHRSSSQWSRKQRTFLQSFCWVFFLFFFLPSRRCLLLVWVFPQFGIYSIKLI